VNLDRELIVDVGSASIGVCLTERRRKEKPTLIKVMRVPVKPQDPGSAADLRQRVQETLKTLLVEFHNKAAAPKHIRVVLASPWYESQVHSISSKSQKPVRISHGTILRAVKSFKEKSTATARGENKEKLESVVTQVYVNGYQTALARAVQGTTMRIELYESSADAPLVRSVRDITKTAFPGAKLTFHSFPLVTFVVLRSLREEEAFTFIDIGGEVTDLAIVHADGLRLLASFSRGTRALVDETNATTQNASGSPSKLSLFARGELSVEEATALKPAFDKAAKAWNDELQKILDASVSETPIPRTTFITADPEELLWFEKVLESGHDLFPTRIIPVTPAFFQSVIALGEEATYDAFLSLEAIFFHTEQKELFDV
jgi:hypothetical protein